MVLPNPPEGPRVATAKITRYKAQITTNASPTDMGDGVRCSSVPSNRSRCVRGSS